MSGNFENFISDFGSDYLNKEVTNWIERNNGDGYHRIKAVVMCLKEEGKTDFAIAKIIKEM